MERELKNPAYAAVMRKLKMDETTVRMIVDTLTMKCPLCGETYRYKINMSHHLRGQHTKEQGVEYLEIIV